MFLIKAVLVVVCVIVALALLMKLVFALSPRQHLITLGGRLGCDLVSLMQLRDDMPRLFDTVHGKAQEKFYLLCYRVKRSLAVPEMLKGHNAGDDCTLVDTLLAAPATLDAVHALGHIITCHLSSEAGSPQRKDHRSLVRDLATVHRVFHELPQIRTRLQVPA